MTLISWILIAFFATVTIRIIPIYQEYFGVKIDLIGHFQLEINVNPKETERLDDNK